MTHHHIPNGVTTLICWWGDGGGFQLHAERRPQEETHWSAVLHTFMSYEQNLYQEVGLGEKRQKSQQTQLFRQIKCHFILNNNNNNNN